MTTPALAEMVADAFDERYMAIDQTDTLGPLLERYHAARRDPLAEDAFREGVDAAFAALCGVPLDHLIAQVTARRLALDHAAIVAEGTPNIDKLREEREQ